MGPARGRFPPGAGEWWIELRGTAREAISAIRRTARRVWVRGRAAVWAAAAGVLIATLLPGPASAQERGNFPTIAKSFATSPITVGTSTALTFVVTGSTLGNTGINFTDSLPGGLVVATPNGLTVVGAGPSCNASNVTASLDVEVGGTDPSWLLAIGGSAIGLSATDAYGKASAGDWQIIAMAHTRLRAFQ